MHSKRNSLVQSSTNLSLLFSKISFLQQRSFILGQSSAIRLSLGKVQSSFHYQVNYPQQRNCKTLLDIKAILDLLSLLHLKIIQMQYVFPFSIRKELFMSIWDAIKKIDEILGLNKWRYVAGNSLTNVDLLYFYEMANLRYYGDDFTRFTNISQWHQQINSIEGVKLVMQKRENIAFDGQNKFRSIKGVF